MSKQGSVLKIDSQGIVDPKIQHGAGSWDSTRQLVWHGQNMFEFRDAADAVTQRNFAQGQHVGTTAYFYTRDHLGSIREMFTGGGTVVARYDYDPYGRSTAVLGTTPTDFNFTGLYRHSKSNLDLAVYRAYDADLGRWLNRDPIAERGGMNLYGYVQNNPLNKDDLIGLYTSAAPANAFETATKISLWAGLRAAGIGAAIGTAIGYPVGQIDLGEEWAPNTKVCDVASDSLTEGAAWWRTLLMAGMSWLAGHSSNDPGSLLRGGPRADQQVPPRPPTEIVAPAGPSPSPSPFFPFPLPTPRR